MARVLDLMRNGQGDEAFVKAKALKEQHEDNPYALNLFGMAHFISGGDEEAARHLFEQAIALDPNYLDAHKNIDRLDIREARFDVLEDRLKARIADGLDSEGSAFRLARLQVSQKRPGDALATLREQASAQPDSVLLRRALLAHAAQQGRKGRGCRDYRRAARPWRCRDPSPIARSAIICSTVETSRPRFSPTPNSTG